MHLLVFIALLIGAAHGLPSTLPVDVSNVAAAPLGGEQEQPLSAIAPPAPRVHAAEENESSNKLRTVSSPDVGTSVWTVLSRPPQWSSPTGLAVMNSSLCAVTDESSNLVFVYSIAPTTISVTATLMATLGQPPTVATTFQGALTNGPPSIVMFNRPQGICAAPALDAFFVLDQGGAAIRKISMSTWITTTVAGSAQMSNNPPPKYGTSVTAASATFGSLSACVADGARVFLADSMFNSIMVLDTAAGTISLIAGFYAASAMEGNGYFDGAAQSSLFSSPEGLAYDSINDELWVADSGNNVIRLITNPGGGQNSQVSTAVGNQTDNRVGIFLQPQSDAPGYANSFVFGKAVSVALMPQTTSTSGVLVVVDEIANRIWGVNMSCQWVAQVAGQPGLGGGFIDGSALVSSLNTPVQAVFVPNTQGFLFLSQGNVALRFLFTGGISINAPDDMFSASSQDDGSGGGGMPRTALNILVIVLSAVCGIMLISFLIVLRMNNDLRGRLMAALITRTRSREKQLNKKKNIDLSSDASDHSSPTLTFQSDSSLSSMPTAHYGAMPRPGSTRVKTGLQKSEVPEEQAMPFVESYVGEMPTFGGRAANYYGDDTGLSRTSSDLSNTGSVRPLQREKSTLSLEDSTSGHSM